MRRTSILWLVAACVACSAGNGGRHSVRDVADRQHERIEQGVEDGSLTPAEARKLREQQGDIRAQRREARDDDGQIDPAERRRLRKQQDKASKQIYEQKQDDDTSD